MCVIARDLRHEGKVNDAMPGVSQWTKKVIVLYPIRYVNNSRYAGLEMHRLQKGGCIIKLVAKIK